MDLGGELDRLYGLPLAEFTAARNALAKDLSKGGEKASAQEVKTLPKPTKTAWALNQLARHDPDAITALLDAGDRLRDAQQRALEGDASDLRAASRAEQEVVERAIEAARRVTPELDEERARRSLRAAAADPATGDLLSSGRLFSDVEAAGFGLEGIPEIPLTGVRRAPARKAASKLPSGRESAANAARPEVEARARREREDREERDAQERAEREARREAEQLAKEAAVEANRAQRRRDEAERAEALARVARQKADDATARAEEAQRRADDAARRAGTL